MIDPRIARAATRQVAALLDPLLRLESHAEIAEALRSVGATAGLEAHLRDGLDELVLVRATESEFAVYVQSARGPQLVHRQRLDPDHPAAEFVRAFRAGQYPDLAEG